MDLRIKSVKARNAAPATADGEQSAFLHNILESSTEYSIIGKDLTGKIELWNAGARRIYGYAPEEVIGKANSSVLHTPEDIAAGKPKEIMAAALQAGKWEGTLEGEYRVYAEASPVAAIELLKERPDLSVILAEIAVAIGAELGFDTRRLEGLRVAGYLHDIGKITIPSEILSKPGKLTSVELQLIRQHSQASYDVLKAVKFPWPVAEIALQHHERIDGSGYPQGLKGEAILLEARIMAVADTVEAMSSHRPYRAGLGIDRALAEVERGRGTAYDPAVADACLKLFREKGYAIPS